jgi:hypothetical protein
MLVFKQLFIFFKACCSNAKLQEKNVLLNGALAKKKLNDLKKD